MILHCPVLRQFRHARVDVGAAAVSLRILLLLAAVLLPGLARAGVELRIEAQPISEDIQAFVTVTNDATGDPEPGLTASDFTVMLDGQTISSPVFTEPPAQSSQRVSVVFAMDYSTSVRNVARDAMEAAVTDFIDAMSDGDMAAIIKFNNTTGVVLVIGFTEIDHATGSAALKDAVKLNHTGEGSPILDAVDLAIDHFVATSSSLPAGPKAVVLITDGGENNSDATQSAVVAAANGNSIPIFTIGVGDIDKEGRLELLTFLAADTGGEFLPAPSDAEVQSAYVTISELLNNEYLLLIPFDAVTDCDEHTIEVTVTGQAAPGSATFIRCDTTPDPISFTSQTGVAPGALLTSNPASIFGIDAPARISVSGGLYSIGCSGTFTAATGTISKGATACVRHTASSAFGTSRITTLTVGGVSGTFTSTTMAAPVMNNGGGGGGGGAGGIAELLLGLAGLIARRKRRVGSATR